MKPSPPSFFFLKEVIISLFAVLTGKQKAPGPFGQIGDTEAAFLSNLDQCVFVFLGKLVPHCCAYCGESQHVGAMF